MHSADAVALSISSQMEIHEPQKEFHIFGHDISFSISPVIHNAGFRHDHLPFKYDIRESPNINDVAHLIRSSNFGGGSVTMPHKLHVHKFCDQVTDTARIIGAINTLVVDMDSDGQRIIVGDNTDWSGLYNIISNYAETTKRNTQVGLVIGAGGASRAALYALHRAGVRDIYLVNRTLSTAQEIRDSFNDMFNIIVIPDLSRLPELPNIIIGTIPADKTTEDQFKTLFRPEGLCIDMAYKPRQTPLLSVAQGHCGWVTVSGIQVLLAQAFDQYRLWTKKEPPKEMMISAVMAHENMKLDTNL